MTTAVFIDGAFFVKRLRHYLPKNEHHNAKKISNIAMGMALKHLRLRSNNDTEDDLYRVFFYDCLPLEKKMHCPITKKPYDLSKSDEAIFRRELHGRLWQ